jgi:hypothetical protein
MQQYFKFLFLQQNTWQSLRTTTMKKMKESQKTGAEGCQLTSVDHLVIDILGGKDSALFIGVGLDDYIPGGQEADEAGNNQVDLPGQEENSGGNQPDGDDVRPGGSGQGNHNEPGPQGEQPGEYLV